MKGLREARDSNEVWKCVEKSKNRPQEMRTDTRGQHGRALYSMDIFRGCYTPSVRGQHKNKLKNTAPRVILTMVIGLLVCCPGALSQCPAGNLNLKGTIEGILPGTAQAEVTVIMKKGKVSKTVDVTGGQFIIDVPFSTLTSYSFLRGHRCNNSPVSVTVKITSDDRVFTRENLTVKDSFRAEGGHRYTLWKNLVVHAENVPKVQN